VRVFVASVGPVELPHPSGILESSRRWLQASCFFRRVSYYFRLTEIILYIFGGYAYKPFRSFRHPCAGGDPVR